MRYLLPLTNAPELAAYPAGVRRWLVQRALFALHNNSKPAAWLGIALPLGCAILGIFVALWIRGYFSSSLSKPETIVIGIEANFSGGPIGCAVGAIIWLHIRALMLRPYLQKVLAEHKQEFELNASH